MTLSRPDNFDTEKLTIHDKKQGANSPANLNESVYYQPESVEFSEPLENSVFLEAPRVRYITLPRLPASVPAIDERSPSISPPVSLADRSNEEVIISLLDERLVIGHRRRKVGEVVVRKEIETYIVEVPIRREKLIVEQVSPTYQQIAVVELGQAQVIESDRIEENAQPPTVSGEFASANEAIQFLSAIIASHSGPQKVQVRVVTEDAALQATYQRWLDQYSTEFTS